MWVYAPTPGTFALGAVNGRIGRSEAPQLPLAAGIDGAKGLTPLRLPTPWTVPGAGPARAVIYGLEGDQIAIELVEVDTGHLVWRDTTSCTGPVVGVTEKVIVCAVATGIRGVPLAGARAGKGGWTQDGAFVAITDDRIVLAGAGEAIILDADDGNEVTRIKMPPGVGADTVIASCGDVGRELFATGQDGRLIRITDAKGGPAIRWTLPMGAILGIDACDGDSVIVHTPSESREPMAGLALVAVTRDKGVVTGRVDGIRGSWPARDGSARLEIATGDGVASWPRDLAGEPQGLPLPVLRELIATRGDQRLVRATPLTAVLLDRRGVRAYLAFNAMGAVLGERSIVGASWIGSATESVHRIGIPADRPRGFRLAAPHAGVAVPAELRDLPAPKPIDLASAIAKPDTAMHAVGPIAIDPYDPAVIYVVGLEREPDDRTPSTVARAHLGTRAWTWQRSDGCSEGTPIAIAVTRSVVACAANAGHRGTVRATTREGHASWEWQGDTVDTMEAAGDTVVVHVADRAIVLDASTGRVRAVIASDDGAPARVAVVELDDTTLVASYESGRIVGRVRRLGMLPAWSVAVAGVVTSLAPSGEGVLVELEDGDAVRIDARTAEATAIPGLGLRWRASGDVITGDTLGGPIPGVPAPPPVRVVRPLPYRRLPVPPRDPEAAPMSTPIPPPPPLGAAWQLTLYELAGAPRARNDYGLAGAVIMAHVRGPAGSPFVVAAGTGPREALVIDPRSGDPLRRVVLPDEALADGLFSTVVDGTPVAGTLLPGPLRVVVF